MKMKAAVLRQTGAPRPYATSRPIQIEEVELDPPKEGEPEEPAALSAERNALLEEKSQNNALLGEAESLSIRASRAIDRIGNLRVQTSKGVTVPLKTARGEMPAFTIVAEWR